MNSGDVRCEAPVLGRVDHSVPEGSGSHAGAARKICVARAGPNSRHSLHPITPCFVGLATMSILGVARTGSYSSPSYLTYIPWPRQRGCGGASGRAGVGVGRRCASARIGEAIGCARSFGKASCLVVASAAQLTQSLIACRPAC